MLIRELMATRYYKKDLDKACPFVNRLHITGDIRVINNHLQLDKTYKDTYPSELQLKKKAYQALKHQFWTF